MKLETQQNLSIDHSRFIFTANKEIIRELVMFPMPPWHLSNQDLIQLPLFLATAIFTSKLLDRQSQQKLLLEQQIWPVEAIAINIRQWETAGFYDKRFVDCNAYTNKRT